MQATCDRQRACRLVRIGLSACLSVAAPLLAHAADAGGSVRTVALDVGFGPLTDEHTAGGNSKSPPVASQAASSQYGASMATAAVSVDGYTGAARAKFSADVAAISYIAGRGANASGALSLTGSIGIVGSGSPGVATFSAVLDGIYTADPLSFNSILSLDYAFQVGSSPEFNGRLDHSRTTGTFAIPFTWTQMVQAGDQIDFSIYLHGSATAGFGLAELDALNTFKITAIDLPPGYSFTPDADGFLSQFSATTATPPVPEPATFALCGMGLIAIALARRRVRRLQRL